MRNRAIIWICLGVSLAAAAASAATVSGTVTDTGLTPLDGIPVDVLRISPTSGKLVRWTDVSTNTAPDGTYTTGDLPASNYWIRVNNQYRDTNSVWQPTGYEGLYYYSDGNLPWREAGRPIVIGAGATNQFGYDFQLREAFEVTGVVSAPGVTNYSTVDFDVYDPDTDKLLPLISAKANADGSYRIWGFPVGAGFNLKCDPPVALGVVPVYQGDVFFRADAQPVIASGGPRTIAAASNDTRAVAVGDVDSDGDIDVVFGNYGQTNKVYLNNGDGSVWTEISVGADADDTTGIALADIDGDGDLDVLTGNYNQTPKFYVNLGNGVFADGTNVSTDTYLTTGIGVADFDEDGDTDIITANYGQPERVYLYDSNLVFQAGYDTKNVNNDTRALLFGRLNDDAMLDLVTIGWNVEDRVYDNGGGATFAIDRGVSGDLFSGTAGVLIDINADGIVDLIVGNHNQPDRFYINAQDATFGPGANLNTNAAATLSLAAHDIDGDGDKDLVSGVSNGQSRVFINDSGTFTNSFDLLGATNIAAAVIAADVNGDGQPDVIIGNSGAPNKVYINGNVPQPFAGFTGYDIDTATNQSTSVAAGDLDVDGSIDIVVGNDGQRNYRLLNDGPGTFTDKADATLDQLSTRDVALAEMQGINYLDLVTASRTTADTSKTYKNNESGDFNSGELFGASLETYAVAVGDLDGDGDIDIVGGDHMTTNRVYRNQGNGKYDPAILVSAEAFATRALALGDVDGDGNLDLAVGTGTNTQGVYLHLGSGDGTFAASVQVGTDLKVCESLALGDLDGDGDLDLAVGYVGARNRIHWNNGAGSFETVSDISPDIHETVAIELGDIDNDGDLDVVTGNSNQVNRIYINNGSGSFLVSANVSDDVYDTRDIALAELNGDGNLDIVEVNWAQTNRVYLNNRQPFPFVGFSDASINYTLPIGYDLSGIVSNISGPVGGMDIDVYGRDMGGEWEFVPDLVRSATNGQIGTFTTALMPANDYIMRVQPDGTNLFMISYYTTNATPALTQEDATTIVVTDADITNLVIMLEYGGSICGTVTDTNGLPLADIDLDVYGPDGGLMEATAKTDTNGYYCVGAFTPTNYTIRVDPTPDQGYIQQYYSNSPTAAAATPIGVLPGIITSNIDFELSLGGNISGWLLDTNGGGVRDIDIDVYDTNGVRMVQDAASRYDGYYAIGPFPPGDYILRADPSEAQGYVPLYYTNAYLAGNATIITVSGNQDVTNVNITLSPGRLIRGTITDTGGTYLANIDLDVFDTNGVLMKANASSDLYGNYQIGPFPPGDYIIRADPTAAQGYLMTYYDGAFFSEDATNVTVTAFADVAGIDFALISGRLITGTITDTGGTPLANIDLDVYDTNRVFQEVNAKSAADGTYAIGPMLPGQYLVRADPTEAQGFVKMYYDGAFIYENAATVTVSAAGNTTNINFSLIPGRLITGIITDGGGSPVAGIDLDVFDTNRVFISVDADSAIDGTYAIGPLLPGDYVVRADPTVSQGFVRVYYDGVYASADASAVTVTPAANTTNISFVLSQGWSIAGTITNASGNPVPGIDIDVFSTNETLIGVDADTDAGGAYTIGPLIPGSYVVRADPNQTQGYARVYYDGAFIFEDAEHVLILPGQDTNGIDFGLTAGWEITGRIMDTNSQPLGGIDIDLFSTNGTRVEIDADSDINGYYAIGPLLPGDYVIRADPVATQGYVQLYYSNAYLFGDADAVAVSGGTDTTNINFYLTQGWNIFGSITGTNSDPLAGIDLDVFTTNEVMMGVDASSLPDGTYRIGPFLPGDYILRADPSALEGYERMYYNQVKTFPFAAPITISFGSDTGNINFQLDTNSPPTVVLAPVTGISNDDIILDVTGSSDPNGDPITFLWSQISGPAAVISSNTVPTPTITLTSSNQLYWFRVVASDFAISSAPFDIPVVNGQIRIISAGAVSNSVTLGWALGLPGQPYAIQKATNMIGTNIWTNVIYSGNALEHTFPTTNSPAFYRIYGTP